MIPSISSLSEVNWFSLFQNQQLKRQSNYKLLCKNAISLLFGRNILITTSLCHATTSLILCQAN